MTSLLRVIPCTLAKDSLPPAPPPPTNTLLVQPRRPYPLKDFITNLEEKKKDEQWNEMKSP